MSKPPRQPVSSWDLHLNAFPPPPLFSIFLLFLFTCQSPPGNQFPVETCTSMPSLLSLFLSFFHLIFLSFVFFLTVKTDQATSSQLTLAPLCPPSSLSPPVTSPSPSTPALPIQSFSPSHSAQASQIHAHTSFTCLSIEKPVLNPNISVNLKPPQPPWHISIPFNLIWFSITAKLTYLNQFKFQFDY